MQKNSLFSERLADSDFSRSGPGEWPPPVLYFDFKFIKESILINLPIYLTPQPPLHEWRGGVRESYLGFIPKLILS